MKQAFLITALVFTLTAAVDAQVPDAPELTRPTIKAIVLGETPAWHVEIYRDKSYQFVYRHFGDAEYVPALLAYDLVRHRWLQITALSTEHARLGRSPKFSDIPLPVGWDFSELARSDYANVPLKTSGSIVFPDRITFVPAGNIYRFDCNSELDREASLTSFWVRRADLDAIQ